MKNRIEEEKNTVIRSSPAYESEIRKCNYNHGEQREVDPGRIGMMGLSQGGTITTFTAAVGHPPYHYEGKEKWNMFK